MNTGWTFSDWLQYAFSFALVIGLLASCQMPVKSGSARATTEVASANTANTKGTSANHGLAIAMMMAKNTTAKGKSIKVNNVLAV